PVFMHRRRRDHPIQNPVRLTTPIDRYAEAFSAAASRAFSRTFEAVLADNSAAVAPSVTTSTHGHLQLHRAWPR
ncbi:hypothetical protein ACFYW8_43040, partial [Streptomyces sp. NPDC002742]|uniref:hypothetical protein n=1 Tax=Streptomyces sp. NPDC002742 TaxID=3364663 RepID=UPI0036A4E900